MVCDRTLCAGPKVRVGEVIEAKSRTSSTVVVFLDEGDGVKTVYGQPRSREVGECFSTDGSIAANAEGSTSSSSFGGVELRDDAEVAASEAIDDLLDPGVFNEILRKFTNATSDDSKCNSCLRSRTDINEGSESVKVWLSVMVSLYRLCRPEDGALDMDLSVVLGTESVRRSLIFCSCTGTEAISPSFSLQ